MLNVLAENYHKSVDMTTLDDKIDNIFYLTL